ncbi:uncharacterized protein N7473_005926 [Penicillium subrubescens]|uniref:uncharacterized protein n=1 Tax=Penicillium subrubescens TaxID=1316194 RepID=UPI0025456678|nr:uncharacterized protein N7473_005926 [Penicillium subrubescens]KAJ5896527.1 hypothetical protein N7473_005926 [Penicillium subrubescens]
MPCGLPQVRHEVDTYLRTLAESISSTIGALSQLAPLTRISTRTFSDLMISIAMKLGLEGSNC